MGKAKERDVSESGFEDSRLDGDNAFAWMLFCEERMREPLPSPDWVRIVPVILRAKTMAAEGTLGRADVECVIAEIRPFVPSIDEGLIREYRRELVKLIAKSKKERAKQAHRERVAASA